MEQNNQSIIAKNAGAAKTKRKKKRKD